MSEEDISPSDEQLASRVEGVADRDPLFETTLAARARLRTAKLAQRHVASLGRLAAEDDVDASSDETSQTFLE
jgi:hypothetical protein